MDMERCRTAETSCLADGPLQVDVHLQEEPATGGQGEVPKLTKETLWTPHGCHMDMEWTPRSEKEQAQPRGFESCSVRSGVYAEDGHGALVGRGGAEDSLLGRRAIVQKEAPAQRRHGEEA